MAELYHLMRVAYRTDIIEDEPEYIGSQSTSIPARAIQNGRQIVDVDWSKRGEVEVTYLVPGPGFSG